ncbi:alpha/beta hydrolase fold protein [Aspergillus nomiae NRRL 13137]|uniref:Alpha/beta hydrolase fold protein n=1 Tax=Aspergillus nomiae NRRL (strain ATCC 15546 / NRRL 13137 / CBS 260.88 / M93) TaxID=1509407 RepID=A0A0L1J6Q9_ASPN3|nr:alpha/beta hydrolase fold protein [Aspergillus nomiae NRRL 13137]KNG87098.1 alpha/beta hydrolase fold protein [Aspergillus nomiae NRRL 13137]
MATITKVERMITVHSSGGREENVIPEKYLEGLDVEWQEMWTRYGRDMEGAHLVTIEQFRQCPERYSFTYPTWTGPEVHHLQDYQVPVSNPEGSITCRVYTPPGLGPFPVHVNFHGGGWVLGGLQSEAAWCRSICNESSIIVIDVDYRLAPEHQYPVALYDCWAAVQWAHTNARALNIDPNSISIGGLSSGGLITAVVAHFARDCSPPLELKLQLMVVPATDMRYVPLSITDAEPLTPESCSYPSAIFCSDLPWSPLARESWFLNYYIGTDEDVRSEILSDWRMTPVLSPSMEGLAPAHIVTAEFDVERDEAEHYGQLLRDAGNRVTMKRYAGVPHAFAHYNHPTRGLSKSHEYIRDTSKLLSEVHGTGQGDKVP